MTYGSRGLLDGQLGTSESKKKCSYKCSDVKACLFHQATEQAETEHNVLCAPGFDRETDEHRNREGKSSPALTSDAHVHLLGEGVTIIMAKE